MFNTVSEKKLVLRWFNESMGYFVSSAPICTTFAVLQVEKGNVVTVWMFALKKQCVYVAIFKYEW